MRLVAVLAVGGLALAAAGCGDKPEENNSGNQQDKFKACMVLDTGGVDDRSFNASAWKGFQEAEKAGGIEISYATSNSQNDYQPNLTQAVQNKCGLIMAVGGLMTEATTTVAKANPNSKFAIIDGKIDLPNVYSMQFNTAQSSFLAGYLAAGMSTTGKVATYGGLKIPPVTIFMDGFWEGVQQYNKAKGKTVQVLGWDEKTQNGSFAESFTDQNKGQTITTNFVSQGADIVFPVAGGVGLGTATVASNSGGKLSVIFVDFDGCESAPSFCKVFLTSAVKNIPDIVKEATVDASKGNPRSGTYVGTLQNNGTFLAPYHEYDSKVPAELKAEVDKLKQDITAGTIPITSPAQPK